MVGQLEKLTDENNQKIIQAEINLTLSVERCKNASKMVIEAKKQIIKSLEILDKLKDI